MISQPTEATVTTDVEECGSRGLLHPRLAGNPITAAALGVDHPRAPSTLAMQTGGEARR
jgi:hypothetical protein